MSVTAENLIQGPATLYKGAFGATEPTSAAINTSPASSAWTDLGGTQDGSELMLNLTWVELTVDQIIDVVGRRCTKRELGVKTQLAEPTLANIAMAINNSAPTSGSGYLEMELDNADSTTQPNYYALLLDGYAPSSLRRRVIIRRAISTEQVSLSYKKDGQTLIPVMFSGHYVSGSVKPIRITDQTS